MFDRIFSAALTFCVLAGGTLAIGSAMLGLDRSDARHAQTRPRVVQLQRVEVIGKRTDPATSVAKTESNEAPQQRVQ